MQSLPLEKAPSKYSGTTLISGLCVNYLTWIRLQKQMKWTSNEPHLVFSVSFSTLSISYHTHQGFPVFVSTLLVSSVVLSTKHISKTRKIADGQSWISRTSCSWILKEYAVSKINELPEASSDQVHVYLHCKANNTNTAMSSILYGKF